MVVTYLSYVVIVSVHKGKTDRSYVMRSKYLFFINYICLIYNMYNYVVIVLILLRYDTFDIITSLSILSYIPTTISYYDNKNVKNQAKLIFIVCRHKFNDMYQARYECLEGGLITINFTHLIWVQASNSLLQHKTKDFLAMAWIICECAASGIPHKNITHYER